jgi:hypothetical protein
LRGYELDDTTLQPGGYLTLDLYWEVLGQPPGNFLLFVHLIDEATGTLIAQRDTHPGLGNFPSSQWQPGDRFVESIRLHASETLYTPGTAELSIGLYASGENSYRLGIADAAGTFVGDALPLGSCRHCRGGQLARRWAIVSQLAQPKLFQRHPVDGV